MPHFVVRIPFVTFFHAGEGEGGKNDLLENSFEILRWSGLTPLIPDEDNPERGA